MVELKCGCEVTDEGKFVLGDPCMSKNCTECAICNIYLSKSDILYYY